MNNLDNYKDALSAKTRKPLRAKCGGCRKIGYAKDSCYKLYSELRPKPNSAEDDASPVTDVLYLSHNE